MHELALTESIVDAVCEHAAGRRVRSVQVQVGALCAVVPDAMQFCFELATSGTVAEGASLDLDVIDAHARCQTCGQEFLLPDLILLCSCGSADVVVLSGRELCIKSMKVG
ncbi:hydrogenase maturation nickel metallochaperone HypA/HybF [Hoyosella subflava]|uniref:Hydrogenase maturation factor HypA n=1 Tax=Hoyosella subflava (strain DSM 45089 / JCM 17490 / NBRC 109087 / DQS3-9A1) TaxID=443218 RepID=F6ENE7_HOYSD|nr:hydrogenase maturation nickel metallochaperone HypA [Hoyosella subflava]AEF40418.1 Hydrogenase nickel insertion protein HypA [Hoyosella subflava DQS3-9A1]